MERLTKKTIGCFQYSLKDHRPEVYAFNDYDTFFNYNMAVKRLGELEDSLEPKLLEEWHEDIGTVLWWRFPIQEPPYCGSPLDSSWIDDYYTHWTPITIPSDPN